MNTALIVLILGIVEGLTEFLPVSSTGHLILVSDLLAFDKETADTFNVVIQVGAILAVIFLYWDRFRGMFYSAPEKDFSGLRAWWILGLTSFPALVLGWLAYPMIKFYFFHPLSVSWALIAGGVGIIAVEKYSFQVKVDNVDKITSKTAIYIGFWQCLALCPGISRSAATIVGSLFLGLNRKTAAEYSFFAAVPVLLCASGYVVYKNGHLFQGEALYNIIGGTLVAFVAASLAIKFFIGILQKWTLAPFGYYRIVLGVLSIIYFSYFSQT